MASGLKRLAEADRTRACETELLGLTYSEDREGHQDPRHFRAVSYRTPISLSALLRRHLPDQCTTASIGKMR
ncbi:hypothetical protein OCAR_5284 [Afipia carboxidovorans OM5]|nr:hypothetical protein OCAR_5284 [Afipia carboxidovorans OM5]